MICPFVSFPDAAAGEPSSTFLIRMVKAGWIKSMPMPTGPKRSTDCSDFFSSGRVENRPWGSL